MHVVVAVLGVLGAAAFWWYRMKHLGQAAGEMVDAAERVRGAYRRRQFRKKADAATLDAIADPRTAAVVLLVAVAVEDGPLTEREEKTIRQAMTGVLAVDEPEEELIFARWAVAELADLNSLVTRLSRVWTAKLDMPERRQLYGLAEQVAWLDGPPDESCQAGLRRLKDRLGLAARPA